MGGKVVDAVKRGKKEKAYTEITENAEVTEVGTLRTQKENPKTQAHTPCLGQPATYWRRDSDI